MTNTLLSRVATLGLLVVTLSCGNTPKKATTSAQDSVWSEYNIGTIHFLDKSPDTEGSKIYSSIIPNPEAYIHKQAEDVLATLYYSPDDSIPGITDLYYTVEDADGISAKGGEGAVASIYYSTRHIEQSFADRDTAKVLFETRGVLLHELTHVFQLSPQGIGDYDNDLVFWCFIEGMADAVRVANGGFGPEDRPRGGNYMDGYRKTGFFLVWLRDNKDPDFLRKFNASTLEVIPWSFNGAIKHIFGENADIDELWNEYQIAVGDIKI